MVPLVVGGVQFAVIGGTGVYDPGAFRKVKEVDVKTEFGKPSDRIVITDFNGTNVAFLPRHGAGHTIPPHMVNYRANIMALKQLGVKKVIGLAAVGSLREQMKPGDVVLPDQFIDMTKQRKPTFYDGPKVVHVSAADPFCPDLRKVACEVIKSMKLRFHNKGTYICIEGPRFSTRAESKLWRNFGADVVGMTLVPEAQLCREAEMCYLSICTVSDYDVWAESPVSTREVIGKMKVGQENVKKIISELVPKAGGARNCSCGQALKDAVYG